MTTTEPLQNQVSQLNSEIAAQIHLDFLQHPFAKKFLVDLQYERDKLLDDCMNLSVCAPINTDMINIKLAKAKQLTETIKHVKSIRPA
jgi:hypothetical protein